MTKKELTKIYKDYNLSKDDIFQDRRGFIIITRSGIEKIQFNQNIKIEFDVIKCEKDNVVIKANSFLLDQDGEWLKQIETFGSATDKNCIQHFKVEIAEKRAKARCIVQTIGLTNTYSEDEIKHQP
tara:strand:+ start:446 stop:823 length:378 start_codon:yes stop_codon:yes gene_type:complete